MSERDRTVPHADSPPIHVGELMTRDVLAVQGDCALTAAMNAVLGSGHRHVVVVDEHRKLLGVLHAEVVATALMTRLADPGQTVDAIVDGDPPGISPFATIHMAAAVMLDREIDALGVVDVDGTLVGLLTWSDICRMVAGRGRP
jgi:CBS domain-containing protein